MTTPTKAPIGTDLPDRCPACGLHPKKQGHRAPCEPSGPLLHVLEGERLAREAMARATQNHPDEAARIDAVIETFARTLLPFSANDVRGHLRGIRGGVVGARFNAAARAGRIRKTGDRVKSTDPGTHAHELSVWIGT